MTSPTLSATPRVLYIAGSAHSGSTLLDMLVSSHSEVVSVGELKALRRRPEARCACGARPILSCPFWSKVDAHLQERVGSGLYEMDVLGRASERFARDNRALCQAVSEVAGRGWVVDSSKSPVRLEALLDSGAFDVLPVHLLRTPAGVVYSHVRKGRSWVQAARHHRRTNLRVKRALAGREHLTVRYEDLALHPEAVLRGILSRMGLDFEAPQLQWAGRERHNLGGNRIRWSQDSKIHLDRDWEQELGVLQRAGIQLIAGRGPRSEIVASRASNRRLLDRSL